MPQTDKIKRRRTSASPPDRTDWRQSENSPVSNDPVSTSPSAGRRQLSARSTGCSPTGEGVKINFVPADSEANGPEYLNGDKSATKTGVDEAEGQVNQDFNYIEAKSFYETASSSAFQTTLHPQPLGPMVGAIHDALITGEFSDMVIKCGTETYNVHRIIVCSQSKVLAHLYSETKIPNTLDLSEETVITVSKMLEYLYTNAYCVVDADSPPAFGVFAHTTMHALGVKYNIKGLMVLAATNFALALRRVKDLEVYFQSIYEVYSQLPSALIFGLRHPSTSPPPNETADGSRAASPDPPHVDGVGKGEEVTKASLPEDAKDSPEGVALRSEVVAAAITELSKILTEPLVVARFHQVSMDVAQFYIDLLSTLAREREEGLAEALQKQEPPRGETGKGPRKRLSDDATEEHEGVNVSINHEAQARDHEDLYATSNTRRGSNGVRGVAANRKGNGERNHRNCVCQDDNVVDKESNDNDVTLTRIRCESCGPFEFDSDRKSRTQTRSGSGSGSGNSSGNGSGSGTGNGESSSPNTTGQEDGSEDVIHRPDVCEGYEIQVICKSCGEACRFNCLM